MRHVTPHLEHAVLVRLPAPRWAGKAAMGLQPGHAPLLQAWQVDDVVGASRSVVADPNEASATSGIQSWRKDMGKW